MQQATVDYQQHAANAHSSSTGHAECGSRHPSGPTAEEWNSVKDVIRQLYVYDQRPLKQVKEHLEANYNFHATYGKASLSPSPTSPKGPELWHKPFVHGNQLIPG